MVTMLRMNIVESIASLPFLSQMVCKLWASGDVQTN